MGIGPENADRVGEKWMKLLHSFLENETQIADTSAYLSTGKYAKWRRFFRNDFRKSRKIVVGKPSPWQGDADFCVKNAFHYG